MKQFTVLIVAPWYPAGPIRFISEAFERIGCRVVRMGPVYNDHMGLDWGSDIVVPDQSFYQQLSLWNLNYCVDLCTSAHQAPDMLLISEEDYQTDIIPTKKIPSVLWSMDGWPRNYDRADLFQCTVNFTNHPLGIDLYPREEIDPRWRFMPAAAAPWIHRDLKLKRDFDFCLLASSYGRRESLCKELGKIEFRVWHGQATTQTYMEAYNRSIATFHNARRGEIKFRFWEAAAMGCINISGWSRLFRELGYLPYEHYIPITTPDENEWPSVDDLADSIRNILGNKDRWNNITHTARKRTLYNDTYYHRCRQIFLALGFLDMRKWIGKTNDTIGKMIKESGLVPQ